MTTSPNIEKLFLGYIEEMGSTPGGVIGFFNPKNLEKGDPKTFGKGFELGAAILESRIKDLDFKSWELEKGKTGSRLKEAIKVYRKMGEEIEQMTGKEPKDYHLYVIVLLMDIIFSLFNHIEIYIEEK